LGRSLYSAEKDMEERVRQIEEQVRQIESREDRKAQGLTVPADLWVESGLDEGGILVVQMDPDLRRRITNRLTRRGYKVKTVEGGADALAALRKASYSLIIVRWGIFQTSGELVGMLRKAFPQTRIIITSSDFAWPNENAAGAMNGRDALNAGAFSYIPDQYINRNVVQCVETAMTAKEKSCPVLDAGLGCNLRCRI
jgi:ActR/RegA family two-component response regulator